MSYILLWLRFDKLWKHSQQLFCNVKTLFQQNRKTEKQGKELSLINWLNSSIAYFKELFLMPNFLQLLCNEGIGLCYT